MLANVRISLKHLQLLAKLLSSGKIVFETAASDESPQKPEEDENDGNLYIFINHNPAILLAISGTKIIPELLTKFMRLISNSKDAAPDLQMDEGYKLFEHMMRERSKTSQVDTVISEECKCIF